MANSSRLLILVQDVRHGRLQNEHHLALIDIPRSQHPPWNVSTTTTVYRYCVRASKKRNSLGWRHNMDTAQSVPFVVCTLTRELHVAAGAAGGVAAAEHAAHVLQQPRRLREAAHRPRHHTARRRRRSASGNELALIVSGCARPPGTTRLLVCILLLRFRLPRDGMSRSFLAAHIQIFVSHIQKQSIDT